MKKIIYLLISIAISSHLMGKTFSNIPLTTGEVISLLSQKEVEEDWEQDFEMYKMQFIENKKISDYLDGKKGFSDSEKGYWISYYGKSNHIKRVTKKKEKEIIIQQIYFLQKVILSSKKGVRDNLASKLYQAINKIYPQKLSQKDILNIRAVSCKNYMIKKLEANFNNLSLYSQNVLCHYYIEQTEQNRSIVINRLKKLLSQYDKWLRDYNNFLTIKKDSDKESQKLKAELTKTENKKVNNLRQLNAKINNFLVLIIKMDEKDLIKKTVLIKKDFNATLPKKYPNAIKSLNQKRGKE